MAVDLAPNALCTTDDVRAAIGNADLSSNADDTLALYINYFSQYAENYCDRLFLKTARTVYLDGNLPVAGGGRSCIFLKAYPVDRTEEFIVWDDPTREFTDVNYQLQKYIDYAIDYNAGVIRLLNDGEFYDDADNLRVDYTGGILLDIDGSTPDCPWDLRGATAQQCAHWWRIGNDPGATQIVSVGGGSVSLYQPTQILPAVVNVLNSYRRLVY